MIKLSAFEYENKLKNPQNLFKNTFKNKSFIHGEKLIEFEKKFSKYCKAEDCAGVSSGTSALQLSLLALGIGPGDEVITVPYTWVSTAECIKQVGAKPIFVDIRKDFCINVDEIKEKINKKTKAIIGVDLYGNVCDIDSLKKFNIPVIEDAAQSTGALYKGKRVGGIADLTCFSFYPTKNLGCRGDAGAVTGSAKLIKKIKTLRNHGQTNKFNIQFVGWNARMDTIQAEILLNKLPYLNKWNNRRREIAKMYDKELISLIDKPFENKESKHVYHQYVILHDIKNLELKLKKQGIQSRKYYPVPLNKFNAYKDNNAYQHSEYCSRHGLAIPVHQYLTNKEVKTIIKAIRDSV